MFPGSNKGIKLFSANCAVLAIFVSLKHLCQNGCISIFQLHIEVLRSSKPGKYHNAGYACARSSPSASYLTHTLLAWLQKEQEALLVVNSQVQNREENKIPKTWKQKGSTLVFK